MGQSINLNHYLINGEVAPKLSRKAKEFALYVIGIYMFPKQMGAKTPSDINCLKKPGKKACPGKLVITRKSEKEVVWECPSCGDFGVIST